jgi:hypothetical protein
MGSPIWGAKVQFITKREFLTMRLAARRQFLSPTRNRYSFAAFALTILIAGPSTALLNLTSVSVDTAGTLQVTYTKDFPECVQLVDSGLRSTHSPADPFCQQGVNLLVALPIEDFSFIENAVRLCTSTGSVCSTALPLRAPPQRLRFYLNCDLAGAVAAELSLPFDCATPQAALLNELRSRIARYAADIQLLFAKRTIRTFAFDPLLDIILVSTPPESNQCCTATPTPFGYELWISARLTDNPAVGTYGGHMGLDSSGAGVASGLRWDKIHDPSMLVGGSSGLQQYWRQIDHLVHEFEHVFGAGSSEYYNLAVVQDTTGVLPQQDLAKTAANPYWSMHTDYFADPLLNDIWNLPLVGSPTTSAALFSTSEFADVSVAAMNHPSRGGFHAPVWGNLDPTLTVPDLANTTIRVVDSLTGTPVSGATVDAWNIVSHPPYVAQLQVNGGVTDALGEVPYDWQCSLSCFGNNQHAKITKVVAPGYQPAVQWTSVFDAMESTLVDRAPSMVISVELTPISPGLPALGLFARIMLGLVLVIVGRQIASPVHQRV